MVGWGRMGWGEIEWIGMGWDSDGLGWGRVG